jgi:hypothetical protein
MHPYVRMRRRHPQELSLPCLDGMLVHLDQDAEPRVGHRGSGTGVRRTVAAARAGLPIPGAVPQIGSQRVLERRQQRHECCCREAGHRSSTPGTRGHFLIAGHRHLPPAMIGLWEVVHDKP